MSNKYKARDYVLDLRTVFFPWCKNEMRREPWYWQHDNSLVHTAKIVSECFYEECVSTTYWPSCSPDLNIIENVWSVLQEKVHESGQFKNKSDLLKTIKHYAKQIGSKFIY